MADNKAIGLYSSGAKLVESLAIIPLSLMYVAYPVLLRYYGESIEKYEFAYNLCFKYVLIIIIPIAVFTSFFSREIMLLFFGPQYLLGAGALAILVWSEVGVFLRVIIDKLLVITVSQKIILYLTISASAINVLLNFFLIPVLGIEGAALATTISYSCSALMTIFFKNSKKYWQSIHKKILIPMIISIVVGFSIKSTQINFWISAFVFFSICYGGLFLAKVINKTDFYFSNL
jgi:O-antigen/teichoic acid export membrane protein